jgi:hypothetical protein
MLNHANISAKRAKEAAAMLRSGKSKVHALKHYQGTLQKEEAKQVDEAGYQVIGTTKDRETFRSKVHPKKAEALSTHYKMAKSRKYKDIKLVKVQEEVEQVDEVDYKKYLKASQEKRPLTMKSVDSALAADKAGDPNPLRKLQNTNAARKFAQKQLTKKFNASQPAQKFPVYEPGRRYVGDSVELDGPTIDEARRMSAAEKLGRAFDSEQQRSALSRQRGLDLLKQKDTEKMQNKLASGNMTKLKKEETEESTMKYIEEKLTAADPASKWISDFVKSDNPKFAGKSKKERIQQALGAYYAKKRGTNEEVEQVDELRASTYASASNKRQAQAGTAAKVGANHASRVLQDKSDKLAYSAAMTGQREFLKTLSPATKRVMSKEEIVLEEPKDAADVGEYDYEGDMAKSQLRSIMANSKRMHDMLEDTTNLPEWVQSKITLAEDYVVTAANYMEGEMNEEVEQVDEADVKSKPVLHKGKSIGETGIDTEASPGGGEWYAKHHKSGMNTVGFDSRKKAEAEVRAAHGIKEEVEQIDELKKSTLASYVGKAAGRLAAASRLQKDFEKDGHTALAGEFEKSAQKKKVGIQKAANKLAKEEAEGKVAVTPKEKSLAAHHGDKTKITYGDVIKARLKSAAAKKMGK